MDQPDDPDAQYVAALRAGDDAAMAPLFENHRERLRRMVQFRMDPRLAGRIDADDVVQDVYLDAKKRLDAFRKDDRTWRQWIRLVALQTLVDVHRVHIGAKMRNAAQELHAASSYVLSGLFVGSITSPSQAVLREEAKQKLEAALESMEPIDREVLMLRHFEELSNKEVAETLGIQENAASNRYVRALARLRGLLEEFGRQ